MDHPEAKKVLQAIARWLELRERGGYGPLSDPHQFLVDADHSLRGGLLERLLIQGKEPLTHTPPLAFSRPWYSLIESGEAVVEKQFVRALREDAILICQSQWRIMPSEKEGFVVSWRPNADGESHWGRWHLKETPDSWILQRLE